MSTITYNGETVPILCPEPNWQTAPTLKVRGRTHVIEALSTAEERHCLVPRPLLSFGFSARGMTAKESATIRRIIEGVDDLPVAVPVCSSELLLTAAASAGGSSLSVEDATGGTDPVRSSLFEALSGYALLWSDFETYELVEVDSFSGATITLAENLAADWPAETRVFPVLVGWLHADATKAETDEVNTFSFTIEEAFHGLTAQGTRETYLYLAAPELQELTDEFELVIVHWTAAPVAADAETLVLQYREHSGSWGEWTELAELDPEETSYETGLATSGRYQFRLRAESCCVSSEWSSTLEWDTGVAPGVPVLSLSIDFPTAELSWTSQPGADSYELERSANDSGVWSAVTTITHPSTTHDDNPATDTDWSYRVRATNSFGTSAWSNVVVAELSTLVQLDADDLSTGSVSSWPDQGPRGTTVYQPEVGFRPSCVPDFDGGGHNAVRFFVQSYYINNPPIGLVQAPAHLVFSDLSDDLDLGVTMFFVGVDDVGQQARPWLTLDVGGSNEVEIRGTYTDLVTTFGGLISAKSGGSSSVNEGFTTMGERLTIWTVRISASAVEWWDGSSSAGTGTSSGLLDALRSTNRLMAGSDLDASQMSEAHLHHVLIKNRPMSDAEVQAKIYELASQYGVSL